MDNHGARRTYAAPKLQDFGSITTLTQGTGSMEGGGGPGLPGLDIEVILDIMTP